MWLRTPAATIENVGEESSLMKYVMAAMLALGMSIVSSSSPSLATASGPASVTTVGHGLKVTLSIPKASYPTNALVATTITAENVSGKPIGILEDGCSPELRAEVLDKHGKPYPPPVDFFPISCGPYVPPRELKPHTSIKATAIVVLQSGNVRSDLTIQAGKQGETDVPGKVLHLAPVAGRPEHVSLTASPPNPNGGLTATISPVQSGVGPLYIAFYEECDQSNGEQEGYGTLPSHWDKTTGSSLFSGILGSACSREEWHFAAGWIGFPVARFDMSLSNG